MAMEVVWTRAFTPVLKTQVYSFGVIVFTYLGATFFGSWGYRQDLKISVPLDGRQIDEPRLRLRRSCRCLTNDPRFACQVFLCGILSQSVQRDLFCWPAFVRCARSGIFDPSLIDDSAAGHPAVAGKAYAINVLGCILGPLFACYVLFPGLNEQHALVLLSLPFFVFYLLGWRNLSRRLGWGSGLAAGAVLLGSLFCSRDFQTQVSSDCKRIEVRRDYAASVMAADRGSSKMLLVNGMGMTTLTPITKFMVHLPLAFHQGPPESALIICFGMGTTYRSALSWNIDTTAVELVPSVPKMFGFYHADAEQVRDNPKGRIVIDDGRRFLRRTHEKFDVIVIDPPPPVEAAGSSLLYSREFYELAKQHLKPHGILQAWFPGGENVTVQAVVRSVHESFPCVRSFPSVEGWGLHLLASLEPIEALDARAIGGADAARRPKGFVGMELHPGFGRLSRDWWWGARYPLRTTLNLIRKFKSPMTTRSTNTSCCGK